MDEDAATNDSLAQLARALERQHEHVRLEESWQRSWTRRLSITLLIYVVVAAYLLATETAQPLITAAVPATGYLMSALVLRQIRTLWEPRPRALAPVWDPLAKAES